MSINDFNQSLDYISQIIPKISKGKSLSSISIHYIGGEVLTIPKERIHNCVTSAREVFGKQFDSVIDGVQTNMIGSIERVKFLDALFEGRISSSQDESTTQRTVSGNANVYRDLFHKNMRLMKNMGRMIPCVVVVDKLSSSHINEELNIASRQLRDISLRPVFTGGKDSDSLSASSIASIYKTEFERWVLKGNTIIEPFFSLFRRKLDHISDANNSFVGCPFQNDCAQRSLSLEANGDLYTCMDIADSSIYKLGNALEGVFSWDTWKALNARSEGLSEECSNCPHLTSCQGGCMARSLQDGNPVSSRDPLCSVWMGLFESMEKSVNTHGKEVVGMWLDRLEEKHVH